MSRVMRRKHVLKEMMDDDYELPKEHQQIVRVIGCRGNNLHEVESGTTEKFLVSMPNKFRKNVWVKRGDFLLVEPIEEGDKVKAEIIRILTAEHIKEFTKAGVWPKQFTKKREHDEESENDNEMKNNCDDDSGLVRNINRQTRLQCDDDCTDDDSDSSDQNK